MIRYLNGISFIFFTLSGPSHPAYAPLQRTQLELRFSAAGQSPGASSSARRGRPKGRPHLTSPSHNSYRKLDRPHIM